VCYQPVHSSLSSPVAFPPDFRAMASKVPLDGTFPGMGDSDRRLVRLDHPRRDRGDTGDGRAAKAAGCSARCSDHQDRLNEPLLLRARRPAHAKNAQLNDPNVTPTPSAPLSRHGQCPVPLQSVGDHSDTLACKCRTDQPLRGVTVARKFGRGLQRI
jgi:hypothetical protein